MKNQRGITLTSLMVYVVAMAMIIITVTNITKYFYNNVIYTETTSEYAEEYLKFMVYISEEINQKDNTVLDIKQKSESNDAYVIFSKTYNQYTFKENAIYKNKEKICDNVKECKFELPNEENKNNLKITIKMNDDKDYTNIYKIKTY